MNKIYVLGAGPGNKDYMLPISLKIIDRAEVVIAGERLLDIYAKEEQKKIRITADLAAVSDYIRKNYKHQKIVVLVSGDPGLYSLLKYLKKHFPREVLKVIPGISSLQLAFARNSMIWQDAHIMSLHGKNNKEKLLKMIQLYKKVGLFTDSENSPDKIADFLLKNNINNKQVMVCENLSYPEEKIYRGSLKQIKNKKFTSLSVMVIYDE